MTEAAAAPVRAARTDYLGGEGYETVSEFAWSTYYHLLKLG